jgi:hypothetical protein
MNNTRSGNDLIGWVASEIQREDRSAHGKIQRPDVNSRQRAGEFRRMDVQADFPHLR